MRDFLEGLTFNMGKGGGQELKLPGKFTSAVSDRAGGQARRETARKGMTQQTTLVQQSAGNNPCNDKKRKASVLGDPDANSKKCDSFAE